MWIRWMVVSLSIMTSLVAAPALAAEWEAPGSIAAGASLADGHAPRSLLAVELRPQFGAHGVGHGTFDVTHFDGELTADEVYVDGYSYDGRWGRLRAAGAGYDYKPLVDAETLHVDIAGFDTGTQRRFTSRLRGFANLGGSFSIAQWTSADDSAMTDIGFELFLCGSASRLGGEVGVELDEAWALVLDAELQGDPVHFTDGASCLGDPPTFTSRKRTGVSLKYTGKSGFVAVRGGFEEEGLHIDTASEHHTGVPHSHDGGGHHHEIVDVATDAALVGSAVAGFTW